MNVPNWKWERYLTGDLPKEDMDSLDALVCEDSAAASRVRQLKSDGEAFLKRHPFESLKFYERSPESSERFPFWNAGRFRPALVAFALLVVVALVSISLIRFSRPRQIVEPLELAMAGDVRVKGSGLQLEVWKKMSEKAVRLENMADVFAGDELQLRYFIPRKCFGILFSMDGNGVLTIHLGNGNRSVELDAGKMRVVPFAYKLDDAPYFEKFFLTTSDWEFSVDENNLDEILNGQNFRTVSVTVKKIGSGKK